MMRRSSGSGGWAWPSSRRSGSWRRERRLPETPPTFRSGMDVQEQATSAAAPANGRRPMVDPFALSIPEREVRHREFTDWAQPGQALSLSLRAPDTVDQARLAAELARMQGLYLTGQNGMPPGPFPLVAGRPIEVNIHLLSQ